MTADKLTRREDRVLVCAGLIVAIAMMVVAIVAAPT